MIGGKFRVPRNIYRAVRWLCRFLPGLLFSHIFTLGCYTFEYFYDIFFHYSGSNSYHPNWLQGYDPNL